LKVFVDDVNIHNKIGLIICNTFKLTHSQLLEGLKCESK
jgi:hypothetical protein